MGSLQNNSDFASSNPAGSSGGGGLPFKIYAAQLTQSGVGAPVPAVAYNNIGTVTWGRNETGSYQVVSAGLFTVTKTVIFIGVKDPDGEGDAIYSFAAQITDASTITVKTASLQANDVAMSDGLLNATSFEIHVYN